MRIQSETNVFFSIMCMAFLWKKKYLLEDIMKNMLGNINRILYDTRNMKL